MDRQIVYNGQVPLETDLLNTNKNTMVGLSKLAAALLGTGIVLNGFTCIPTGVASLQVQLTAGEIYSLQNIDGTAYSSLAADTTHQIIKQGILLDTVLLTATPPVTAGQSINYLVQVTYADSDTNAVVLPYYNASNPSVAYSGPANAGTTNNTVRKGLATVNIKSGVAATTGSQTTPAPDSGYTGMFVVTVANGQTTITSASISTLAGAPFVLETINQKVGQASSQITATATGTSDALVGTYSPVITTLVNGITLMVRAMLANSSATPTFQANGTPVKTIVKGNNLPLVAGDIAGAGHWIELQYDFTLDKWVLLNPATGVSVISASAGTVISYAGNSPPTGYLTCPLSQTYVNATTYSNLAFAIGVTWGNGGTTVNAGSFVVGRTYVINTIGTTNFTLIGALSNAVGVTFTATGVGSGTGIANDQIGLPWFPADYVELQANSNVGVQSVGVVLAHTHGTSVGGGGPLTTQGGANQTTFSGTQTTSSQTPTGGTANLAAGSRVLKCVKY